MAKISAKQELFVDEYLIDLNATQAAIRAGYSPKTAEQQGSRLLSNVKVKGRVAEKMAERRCVLCGYIILLSDQCISRKWMVLSVSGSIAYFMAVIVRLKLPQMMSIHSLPVVLIGIYFLIRSPIVQPT